MDLSNLVSTSMLQGLNSQISINHIFRGSVLLGRIVNFHSQLHKSHDDFGQSTEFANLENVMSLFSFALSRDRNEREDLTQEQLGLHCWLNVLVQTCNTLLHHPMASTSVTGDVTRADLETSRPFQLCFDSMRRIVDVTKRTNRISPQAVGNPFLVTSYFLCCRFLIINWYEYQTQSDRDDVDFILMLVNRIGNRWPKLAKKFSKGIMADLGKTGEEARKMRIGTGSYLDVGCA